MATGRRLSYCNPRLLRTIFLQLQQQQESGLFCDVTLQADGDGLHAHSCVVAACSPYLAQLLRCPGSITNVTTDFGGRDLCSRRVIHLGGIPRCHLFPLVRYMYTSELEVALADARGVIKAAKKLQIPDLESLVLEGGRLVRQESGRRLNRGCLGSKEHTPVIHHVQQCRIEQVFDAKEENKPLRLEVMSSEFCSPDILDNRTSSQGPSKTNQIIQVTMLEKDPVTQDTLKRTYDSPNHNTPEPNEQIKSGPGMLIDLCKMRNEEEKQAVCGVSENVLVKKRRLNREKMLNIVANTGVSCDKVLNNNAIIASTKKCEEVPIKGEATQLKAMAPSEVNDKDSDIKDQSLGMECPAEFSIPSANLGGENQVHSDLKLKCNETEEDLIPACFANAEPSMVAVKDTEEPEEQQIHTSEKTIHEVEKVKLRKLKNGHNWEIVNDGTQQSVDHGEREEHLAELEELLEQMFELSSPSSDVDVGGYSPTVWLGEGVWPDPPSESDEDVDVLD